MPATSPAPSRHRFQFQDWQPSARSLLWVLAAFVAGLVLFALATSGDRAHGSSGATLALPTAAGPDYAPLPTPLPGERDGASGMGKTPEMHENADKPRLVEAAPAPHAPEVAAAHPAPVATALRDPKPIPGQSPAPRYPAAALRRGESGTVTVRAEIGVDGVPDEVSVATSSGSRLLDRAAMDAVRRWRFTPAMRDGEAATGTIVVPITFEASR